jgi:hypothetical protein
MSEYSNLRSLFTGWGLQAPEPPLLHQLDRFLWLLQVLLGSQWPAVLHDKCDGRAGGYPVLAIRLDFHDHLAPGAEMGFLLLLTVGEGHKGQLLLEGLRLMTELELLHSYRLDIWVV